VSRLLVVTAVAAERDAIAGTPGIDVLVGGIGPAESAAATARALAPGRYDRVLSAGIAGGFAGVEVGSVVIATSIVFADLGAETGEGFLAVDELGFGRTRYDVELSVYGALAAPAGTILTVSTVTGTATTKQLLSNRYPDAVAEAMEGAGVAAAAAASGVAFGEVRAISNLVGPRDRSAWRIPGALAALAAAFARIEG
jgi:futalosine hydrolase